MRFLKGCRLWVSFAGCGVGMLLGLAVLLPPVTASGADGTGEPRRLYEGLAAYVPNPDGAAFAVRLEVRDLNHQSRSPSELMVKILDPDGRMLVREVLPDDGLTAPAYAPPAAGWDHEAWYYAACRSRGIEPMVSWSHFTDPAYLGAVPVRPFSFSVPAGPAGVYRILIFGGPDHVVTMDLTPALPHAVAGTINWLHGHGAQYRRSFLYVPRGAKMLYLSLLENDLPASRTLTLRDSSGNPITLRKSGPAEATNAPPGGLPAYGLTEQEAWFAAPGALDDQILTLDISEGTGAFLVLAAFQMSGEPPTKRLKNVVNALFAPDAATARAAQGGAIYHDGRTFWHPFQVRYHDWLKTLTPEDYDQPAGLPVRPDFHSVGSHQSPAKDSADRLMHDYPAHRNRQVLNLALREMANGLDAIGPGDMVVQGPMKNLAYEMGCYSFFYHRPAWRILQESDAPEAAKGPIREFILTVGDRLAFCRGGELINGNALASLVAALRYCAEASRDPLQESLFDTYWDRFAHGGFGDRIGIGPSGAIQESFGYDHNYGSYVLRGWRAVNADLKDPRFLAAYDRVQNLYSYTHSDGMKAAPWSSRTDGGIAGGTYSSTNAAHRWKGYGGPDFTENVNGGNEFFAVRRPGYYVLTYHGRLTPTWFTEGFHGQVGYGGGMLCQLVIPAKGQVLVSTLNGAYGAGMHPSQWRNFHIHSLVGATPDGQPLVSANSEQPDARLEGTVLTGSGEVRQSSVRVFRRYDFQPDRIVCEVRLAPSQVEALFDLYGGRSQWRGQVGETWEMIPFANAPVQRRGTQPPLTRLTALDADGHVLGPVGTSNRVDAAMVEIDRHGFGCRVVLSGLMPVLRGANDTLLIRLADEPTPATEVALTYTLVPYIGPSALEPADAATGL